MLLMTFTSRSAYEASRVHEQSAHGPVSVHSGHSRWAWLWLPTKVHYLWCLHAVLLNSKHILVYWSQFFNKFNSCAYNSLRCLDIQIWWFLSPQQWQWQQQQNWLLYSLHTCVGWYKHNNLVVKRIEDWVISCQDRAMHNIIVQQCTRLFGR